jgi:hypothetical protein
MKQGRSALCRPSGSNGARAPDSGGIDRSEFPSARYFQIHFEYIEELLDEIRQRLDALRQQVADCQPDSGPAPADTPGYRVCMPPGAPVLALQGGEKRQKPARKASRALDSVPSLAAGK